MLTKQVILVSIALYLLTGSGIALAQNNVSLIPVDDDLMVPIVVEEEPEIPEEPEFLDEFFTKPLIFNKGWDQNVPNRIRVDPTVNIVFRNLDNLGRYPGLNFSPPQIRHWGEQTLFPSSKEIFAAAVLMVDKGDTLEGGRYEWSLNNQSRISFHNIVRKDFTQAWIAQWTDPRPGDTVYFFLMSDDERFSSNPITFTWPAQF